MYENEKEINKKKVNFELFDLRDIGVKLRRENIKISSDLENPRMNR